MREARHRGADLILVIRTLPSGISPVPALRQHMHKALVAQRQAPDGKCGCWEQHERIYAATQHFIDAPPRVTCASSKSPRASRSRAGWSAATPGISSTTTGGNLCGLQFLRKIVPRLQQHRHAVPDEI